MSDQLVSSTELVSVCICTFRRPASLLAALESVAAQILPPLLELELVVVDNDSVASARAACHSFQSSHPSFRCVYAHDPTRGVSFARNRCLQEASGRWVAFLDDDERAPELWLASLLDAARVYGADAVFGPVLPLYEGEPADWLIKDQPHERTRFATGTPIGWKDTHTGNVLMKRSVIEMVGGFDARFAQTGGEDCFFFACALKCGARLVWSDDATIWEVIPQQRMTRRWVIQRAFHGGRTYVRVQAALQGRRAYVKWFAHGLGMFLVLAGPAALMWMLRRHGWLFYVTKLASAAGKLVAVGYSSGPYG